MLQKFAIKLHFFIFLYLPASWWD